MPAICSSRGFHKRLERVQKHVSLPCPWKSLSPIFPPVICFLASKFQEEVKKTTGSVKGLRHQTRRHPLPLPPNVDPTVLLAATNLPQTLSAPEIILSSCLDSTQPSWGLPEDLPVTQIQPCLIPGFKITYFNNRKNKQPSFKNRQKTSLDVSPKKLDNDQ